MRERVLTALAAVTLAVTVVLVIWQGSFTFGEYAPTSIEQTYLFWAISTLIFLLMVTVGFMLFRTGVRLYIERQVHRRRTGIKTKMVIGALALTFIPIFFMFLFSVYVLNRNLDKWFSRPSVGIRDNLSELSVALETETRQKAEAQADWLAALPQTRYYLATSARNAEFFDALCRDRGLGPVYLVRSDKARLDLCPAGETTAGPTVVVRVPVAAPGGAEGALVLESRIPADLGALQAQIERNVSEYNQLAASRKATRGTYLLLLALITLFILFVATWIALFLARQINVPIAALLAAADQVRRGNLAYRLDVAAIDELASLVTAFNEMTEGLETNARELESRRLFIEAILENTPSGVVSVAADGAIGRSNRALAEIFTEEKLAAAKRLPDLFPPEEAGELQYLLNRARRTGVASRPFDFKLGQRSLHLSVTVSALKRDPKPGFVVLIEDTSELLRAQKAAAWREVARRIAHEIKNPLTPISLSAQRIARHLDHLSLPAGPPPAEVVRILKECAETITQEVEGVRTLVDEFSQFARFPAAQPETADLNEVVSSALAIFAGRLDGIELTADLADNLPPVRIDREQFKRVVVNLVDNSAEGMDASPTKKLYVATRAAGADAVELEVTDTGDGISIEDKEKLFLPYFSTKGRGTGLGLAIVHQILRDHGGQIRVEDNFPTGARFILEIPALAATNLENPLETSA